MGEQFDRQQELDRQRRAEAARQKRAEEATHRKQADEFHRKRAEADAHRKAVLDTKQQPSSPTVDRRNSQQRNLLPEVEPEGTAEQDVPVDPSELRGANHEIQSISESQTNDPGHLTPTHDGQPKHQEPAIPTVSFQSKEAGQLDGSANDQPLTHQSLANSAINNQQADQTVSQVDSVPSNAPHHSQPPKPRIKPAPDPVKVIQDKIDRLQNDKKGYESLFYSRQITQPQKQELISAANRELRQLYEELLTHTGRKEA
jgi:hypothetical protein